MKKYWQLLLIVVVILATVSVHYIQVASAPNQTYKLTFEKISGDDKYVDSLKIEGYYETGNTSKRVILTKDEVEIESSLLYDYTTLTMKELIDNHKAFMRGKMRSASNFYEDDAYLIYAEEPEEPWDLKEGDTVTFNIDVLNKNEDKTDSFSVSSKLTKPVSWISVYNTILVNNELKLITTHSQNNGDNELHLVTIDLKKQQLLSDTILDTSQSTEKIRSYFNTYNDYENFGQEKYYVYSIDTFNEVPPYNLNSKQFKVINIETNELTDLEVPENVLSESSMSAVDNNYLVISNRVGEDLVLYRYNIGQKRWLEPITVTAPIIATTRGRVINDDPYTMQVTNGKIYLFNEVDEGFLLRIFDIETNESLYEGILKRKDANQKFKLWVNRFHEMNK